MASLAFIENAFSHPRAIKYRQFIIYCIIGLISSSLDLVTFLILYNVFNINPLVATSVSITLGITNSFICNLIFNFSVRQRLALRFMIFYGVGLLGLLLSVLIIYLLHSRGNMGANLAKVLSIPPVVFVQYFLNSRISLSRRLGS